jgi:hypothetical protein
MRCGLYLLYKNPDGLSAAQNRGKKLDQPLAGFERNRRFSRQRICRTTEATGKRRYNWKFVLTQDGIALARQIGEIAREVQTYADRDITQDELEQFYTTLQKLKANFSYITDTIDKGEKK